MKFRHTLAPLAAHVAGLSLTALLLLQPGTSAAQYYDGSSYSYGTVDGGMSYMSKIDMEAVNRRNQREEDRRDVKDRRREESKERSDRERAAHQPYVPKAPVKTEITMNNVSAPTVAEMSDSLFSSQQSATRNDAARASAPRSIPGKMPIFVGEDFYYYSDGLFFVDDDGNLVEIPGPDGAIVPKIPKTVQPTTTENGQKVYIVGQNVFRKVLMNGMTGYAVIPQEPQLMLAPPTNNTTPPPARETAPGPEIHQVN